MAQATQEQLAVCNSKAQVLKVKAFAGTGKTTTLLSFAVRNAGARILYIAFNKGIQLEAEAKFRNSAVAKTIHSMAFAAVGRQYAHKLGKGDLKPYHVIQELNAKHIPTNARNLYGARIIETLKNYLVSSDLGLSEHHVVLGASPTERKHFDPARVLADTDHIWSLMQRQDHEMPMIHDGYLKLFHCQQPQLPFDIVLLDEYQDTNPVTQAIVDLQQSRKVYVGDEHQAIYAFRGARNAMAIVSADEEHALTGSFRFGPEVAAVANAILRLKGETLSLQGLGPASRLGPIDPKQPFAYIARSNAALFSRAIQAVEDREAFAFLGDLSGYRFDLIEQTYQLSLRERVHDAFLRSFPSYSALEEYAEEADDKEVLNRCRLVNRYGKRLPSLLRRIEAAAQTYVPGSATKVVLTSAHRAKGMEFEQVQLADDFMDFYDDKNMRWRSFDQMDVATQESINLQYVAATRAQRVLQLGPKLQSFWVHSQKTATGVLK